jgi:hypothetical protein
MVLVDDHRTVGISSQLHVAEVMRHCVEDTIAAVYRRICSRNAILKCQDKGCDDTLKIHPLRWLHLDVLWELLSLLSFSLQILNFS